MGIVSDLSDIKDVSDTIQANKVSKFCYTDYAYEHDDADGVTSYDVNQEQNIPVGTPTIMKVNNTVVTKGWRARASSITRMFMNHMLGRLSYNVNKISDMLDSLLTAFNANLGVANGLATLDASGRIPYSQLPESAVELKGYWDASTNTPELVDGTGTNGDEYFVSVAGSQNLGSGTQYFAVGDRIVYTSGIWKNINSGTVRSVNNQAPDAQGNVALSKSDIGLGNVVNTGDSATVASGGTQKFTTGGAFDLVASLLGSSYIFNPSSSYPKGSVVFNSSDNKIYIAKQTHSGAWDSSHFDVWTPLQAGFGLTLNIRNLTSDINEIFTPGIHIFKNNTDSSHLVYAYHWQALQTYFNGVSFTIIQGVGVAGSVYYNNEITAIDVGSGDTLVFIGYTTANSSEELFAKVTATITSR